MYARWAEIYVTSLTVTQNPNKTNYFIGDSMSVDGGIIKADYNDGSSELVNMSRCEVSYPDKTTSGTKKVTISYKNRSTSYEISIETPYISISGGRTGESLTSFSAKTYPAGQNIIWSSSDDGVVKVSNGNVQVNSKTGNVKIYARFTYNGYQYEASKDITVAYSGWSSQSDYKFVKEATSDLKMEEQYTLYYWYWFECPSCGAHNKVQHCDNCRKSLNLSNGIECYSTTSFNVVNNQSMASTYISGECLLKRNNNYTVYYNANLNNCLVYAHKGMEVFPAYRYRTRTRIIDSIK